MISQFRINALIAIFSVLFMGCLSCSEAEPKPEPDAVQKEEDQPKEDSDKFITVIPESVTYNISEGDSMRITTGIPTAVGRYSVHFGDSNEQPITETLFERGQSVVIVNPIETDYFRLVRADDSTYTIDLLPVNTTGPISIRIRFYPLYDRSYLFGELYVNGK